MVLAWRGQVAQQRLISSCRMLLGTRLLDHMTVSFKTLRVDSVSLPT